MHPLSSTSELRHKFEALRERIFALTAAISREANPVDPITEANARSDRS